MPRTSLPSSGPRVVRRAAASAALVGALLVGAAASAVAAPTPMVDLGDASSDLGGELNLRVCAVAGPPSAMTRVGSSLPARPRSRSSTAGVSSSTGLADRHVGLAELRAHLIRQWLPTGVVPNMSVRRATS
jgi:hypothetical protein